MFFGPGHLPLHWDHPKLFFKGLLLILHPFLVRTGIKNYVKIFLPKGGSCLSHFIRSMVVQNAVFRGYSNFCIHFWPENAQKSTIKFLKFFGSRHPALHWDRPIWFLKVLFLILHPLLVRTDQKNNFWIFWLKRQKRFWPLDRVKGGPKCVFSGIYSVFYSFLARKCSNNHFEIFDIFDIFGS